MVVKVQLVGYSLTPKGQKVRPCYRGLLLGGLEKAILNYLGKRRTPATIGEVGRHLRTLGYTGKKALFDGHLADHMKIFIRKGYVRQS